MSHEDLKIESYSLGYLAYSLNRISPTFELVALEIPAPAQDNCFVQLMREFGILPPQKRTPLSTRKVEYMKCVTLYRLGYRDSLENKKSLVKIVKRKPLQKIWRANREIK